jgi:hypothetical protein
MQLDLFSSNCLPAIFLLRLISVLFFDLVLLTKHNWNDEVKEDEMGRECSTNWGDEDCV